MAAIVHTYQWDRSDRQYFLALNPGRDELNLYESVFQKQSKSYTTNKSYTKSDFDSIQTYGYASNVLGLVGLGTSNGSVNVFNMFNADQAAIKIKPKQPRPCNALSFNNEGLLATGLDKVRNDTSLLIWDIEHSSSISEDAPRTPLESFMPNEVVVSVAFLRQTPKSVLCGSYKSLREFDLRTPTPIFQCAAKCSHGITVNPLNDNYFSTYSEDGAFALWDRRSIKNSQSSEPALYMTRMFGETNRKNLSGCFRFSHTNAHEFASLNDGNMMRRWQIGVQPVAHDDYLTGARQSKLSLGTEPRQRKTTTTDSLFVSCVLDSRTDFDRVVSFDYTSDTATPYSVNFVCIRQSGQVFRMKYVESPDAMAFDPHNNVAVVDPERITIVESQGHATQDQRRLSLKSSKENGEDIKRDAKVAKESDDEDEEDEDEDDSDKESVEENVYFVNPTFEGMLDYRSVLGGDISCVMRKRALAGYSLQCEKNIEILYQEHGDGYLKYAWQWMLCARRAEQKKSMLSDTLDLGFEGVLGIWEGSAGLHGQRRQRVRRPITEKDFETTVVATMAKASKNPFISAKVAGGSKHVRRRLCLRVAGWSFDIAGLDREMENLMKEGKHEQAAGWAVFHDDVSRAVECLANSKKERLRLMSTAVAGYLAYKDSTMNSPWREQCRKLASELDDPYLRAIFAFISDGSWTDVLDEGSLPLVERLGIAFRFLPDDELTTYLNRVTERAVSNGDLEGIMLTGITPRVIPLLQSYVDKTTDVQTASLIVSFASPRYFEDKKAHCWIEEYRRLLNSWRMFGQRAKFDVSRNHLSVDHAGERRAKQPPRQIYLKCTHCGKTIGDPVKTPLTPAAPEVAMRLSSSKVNLGVSRCPHCNNPLPRCVICLLPLGASALPMWREGEGGVNSLDTQLDKWSTFCLSCNHGLHCGHARVWFEKHDVCPVPDCNCQCNRDY